jgi:dihydropteroate synthase
MNRSIICRDKLLDLTSPVVMGILNITPDSFSDGGELYRDAKPQLGLVESRAQQMIQAGAGILDVGGESTRPGADQLSIQEELDRVIPAIEVLSNNCDTVISVDTSTPQVMLEAVAAGAHMINDVRALEREGALEAALKTGLPVCLMHMKGEPADMQDDPQYDDVVAEVSSYLANRIDTCIEAGYPRERLLIDPGFGFGKTTTHNLTLLNRLAELGKFELPVVVGLSRKRSIGEILDKAAGERLYGSLSAAVIAALNGASIVRAHDIEATVDAVRVVAATRESGIDK